MARDGGRMSASPQVTQLLNEIERGDPHATDELLVILYEELRVLAHQKMAHERPGMTIQATALVHDAYVRLVGSAPEDGWANRAHFFSAAATTMGRILVEQARRRNAVRHGGDLRREDIDSISMTADGDVPAIVVDLHEALDRFRTEHPDHAKLVELRVFLGMTKADAAEILGIGESTADRYWHFARVWLFKTLQES